VISVSGRSVSLPMSKINKWTQNTRPHARKHKHTHTHTHTHISTLTVSFYEALLEEKNECGRYMEISSGGW